MAVFIVTGGTGLVGKELVNNLLSFQDHKVFVYTRDKKQASHNTHNLKYVYWNPANGQIDTDPFTEADYIINLAGAGIADKRWTKDYKKVLLQSRLDSVQLLYKTAQQTPNKLKSIISASAIGYYGNDKHSVKPFEEDDTAANDFLAQLCVAWENAVLSFSTINIKPIILRTGIVLGKGGGTLKELLNPLKFKMATILGNGKQIYSWIDVHDLASMYVFACLQNDMPEGKYNAVAPNPISQKTMVLQLARKISSFYIPLYTPKFLLQLMIGEVTGEVLKSAQVSAQKIIKAGFHFDSPNYKTFLDNNF